MNYINEKLFMQLVFGTKCKNLNLDVDKKFIEDFKLYVETMSKNKYLNKRMQNNIYAIVEYLRANHKQYWDDLNDIISLNNNASDQNIILYYFAEYVKRNNIELDPISSRFEFEDFLEQDLTSLYKSITKDYEYYNFLLNNPLDENMKNVLKVLVKDKAFNYCINGFKQDGENKLPIMDKLNYIDNLNNPTLKFVDNIKKLFKRK